MGMARIGRGFRQDAASRRTVGQDIAAGYSDVTVGGGVPPHWNAGDVPGREETPVTVAASTWRGHGATTSSPTAGLKNGIDRAYDALKPAPAPELGMRDSDSEGDTRTADREKGAGANPPNPVK